MEYQSYFAKIEYSADDEMFFGVIEGINDIISFEGTGIEDLKIAFHEAVEDYLVMCQRYGKEPQKAYKGSFNVRIDPELHKKAAMLASSKGTSLNQFVESAIADKIQTPVVVYPKGEMERIAKLIRETDFVRESGNIKAYDDVIEAFKDMGINVDEL